MSASSVPPVIPPPPGTPVVAAATEIRAPRQPLGLPAGSVRALLLLLILGLIWGLMLFPSEKEIRIPLYLYYLIFLGLGHFFAAHGQSIAGPTTGHASPLHLPRGTLRTIFFLGFLAVLGYPYYVHKGFEDLLKPQEPLLQQAYLPLVILGGFFFGIFLNRVVGRMVGFSPPFQDILAWLAILATLGLCAEVLIQLAINPSVDPEYRIQLGPWHVALSAIISLYFGARS
jgi:hypothetical protein